MSSKKQSLSRPTKKSKKPAPPAAKKRVLVPQIVKVDLPGLRRAWDEAGDAEVSARDALELFTKVVMGGRVSGDAHDVANLFRMMADAERRSGLATVELEGMGANLREPANG